jgi:hypothetical protein
MDNTDRHGVFSTTYTLWGLFLAMRGFRRGYMAQHRRTRCDGYLVYRRSIGVRLTLLRTYLRRPRQVLIAGCMMLAR